MNWDFGENGEGPQGRWVPVDEAKELTSAQPCRMCMNVLGILGVYDMAILAQAVLDRQVKDCTIHILVSELGCSLGKLPLAS